ncbi:hypothetical protein Q2T41_09695 [Maribacter confluentis]|uniref:Uncharacterized protein n=2 Tax=Maribacter TaxID=252356 RepID=A0ABY1SCJ7_9FLAO|nr:MULTISPECIES: DUF6747 family protein [Maribacter]MDO1512926.1 hypothetical protein [Maribacter confluentis]TVZ16160.1 hypothetical protein JM81_2415 [Maribacter sp. MAR_2009_72]SNR24396.1 hypothetical protein SAMN04488009_0273 [Maribacter sedimenticola]
MEKIILVKEIYTEAFRNWRSYLLENYFKLFSWLCFILIGLAMYALIYRVSTGFSFSNL